MRAVVPLLLGPPTVRTRTELRYGRRGSLCVHVGGSRAGTWFDFEHGQGGGVLDLIARETGRTLADARDWLRANGMEPPPPGQRPRATPATTNRRAPHAAAARLWDASERADDTPARLYLAGRLAWPPPHIDFDLPADCRWIPAERWPAPQKGLPRLPEGSAGAIAFAHRQNNGTLTAVNFAGAVDSNGHLVDAPDGKRWRRSVGKMRGSHFTCGTLGGPIRLVEGPVDALAKMLLRPDAEVWSVSGTAGFNSVELPNQGRDCKIDADADPAGRAARNRVTEHFPFALALWRHEGDPADDLKHHLTERLAIVRESNPADSPQDEAATLSAAWRDFLNLDGDNHV